MSIHLSIECDVCGNDEQFDSIEELESTMQFYGEWNVCQMCGDVTCDACVEEGKSACECDEPHRRDPYYQGHPNRARALPAYVEDTWGVRPEPRAPNTEPCPACGLVHSAR